MGVEIDYVDNKNLDTTDYWVSQYKTQNGYLNTTNAFVTSGVMNLSSSYNITLTFAGGGSNGSNQEHIAYYKCKSENFTIGTYQGTGVAGNFIETKDVNGVARKPRRVITKAISAASNWVATDSQRGTDYSIYLNLSNAEDTGGSTAFYSNGFSLQETHADINGSGVQYLYLVEFDTNSDGGDGYFNYPTDDTNLNITSGKFTFTDGIGDNGYNVSTESFTGSIDFAGVSDGIKYIGRQGTSWVFEDKQPMFSMYEKTSADDNRLVMVDGTWYNTTGSELVTNGTFDSDVSGWTIESGNGLVYENGYAKAQRSGGQTIAYELINTEVGKKYIAKMSVSNISMTSGTIDMYVLTSDSSTLYGVDYIAYNGTARELIVEFIAETTSTKIAMGHSSSISGQYSRRDNVTCYAVEPTIGTAVTTPISFLTKPYQVQSETPQAEMSEFNALPEVVGKVAEFDRVDADEYTGKNACTSWCSFDGISTVSSITDGYNISSITRVGTGLYNIYFEKDMDNTNYSVSGVHDWNNYTMMINVVSKSLNKFQIIVVNEAGNAVNSNGSIHIFGGKN
jgi:hypothetical protein